MSDAELEEFTSVAARLMQVQEQSFSRQELHLREDSSQPAPLDDLYHSDSHPVTPQHAGSLVNATTLNSIVRSAPEPLQTKKRFRWILMIVISLLSLLIGALLTHFVFNQNF